MCFFGFRRVAEGYAKSRPYYHPTVVAKIREHVHLNGKFASALDVGCGTGLSTLALQDIAENITGVDDSAEMIAVAQRQGHDGIAYRHAPAEQLSFAQNSFDLVTVSGAINWIDRSRFFPEARRVLKDQGWLVIYDNFVTEHMRESAAYERWYKDQYLVRYPKPPRDETPITEAECRQHGFRRSQDEILTTDIRLSLDEYINVMVTQSNVIVAVDLGEEKEEQVKEWMRATLGPAFPPDKGTFPFRGYILYLQRC